MASSPRRPSGAARPPDPVGGTALAAANPGTGGIPAPGSPHDRLTGLPTRSVLLDRLAPRVLLGAGGGTGTAGNVALVVGLDAFTAVNDVFGRAGGDQVLVETAGRLSRILPSGDVLARLGDDEFGVLGTVGSPPAADALARHLLTAFDEPFVLGGREAFLSASVGVAVCAPGSPAGQLLADAALAMRHAKAVSGPAAATFHPGMRQEAAVRHRLDNEIRRARERGQLRAVYQPIVDLNDGRVRGLEALLRWRHPELGDVPAADAVAAGERVGLSGDLTCWIVGEACAEVARWNLAHPAHAPLRLAVNVSPVLLADPAGMAPVEDAVARSGLSLTLLDVELTESALAAPCPEGLAAIARLRGLGARLAMDDFGTGYSTLVSLVSLPFDVLKVDRSFVSRLDDGDETMLIPAITAIARGRNLETVGEGIETPVQLAALVSAECDLGQGYLFARPMEAGDLDSLVALETRFGRSIRQARLGAAGAGAAPEEPVRSGTVLVVDDNPADRKLLRLLLDSAGYDVEELAEPARLGAALAEHRPDVVLLDLRMAGANGLDLLEEAGGLLTMPVVAVTGYPRWAIEQDPRSRRFDGVVAKPVDRAALLEELDWLLPGSRPAGSGPPRSRATDDDHHR